MGKLDGKKIVFLTADMTHDEELNYPRYHLMWEGAEVTVAGLSLEQKSRFGMPLKSDITVDDLDRHDFDAAVIPGGFAPDKLRVSEPVLNFVRKMFSRGRLIAAICHGPQVLISAGVVKDKRMTCVKAVAVDLVNAGAIYEDKPVVRDGNLITSRIPTDLPGFTSAIVEALH